MFCSNCGQSLEDTAKFCSGCGASVAQSSVAASDCTSNAAPESAQPEAEPSPRPVYVNECVPPPPPQKPAPDAISATPYLVWSIIVTILCFLPTGIPAIVFASKIGSHVAEGNTALARDAAKKSRLWTILSAVLGVVLNIVGFFLLIALIGEMI